jgi:hypothetical protein
VITRGNKNRHQPDLLVDKKSEELDDLHKGLRYYADKLDNLISPTWSNPCLILDKLGELEELVDDHDLTGAWFSAHAKVDDAVVMVRMPEICLVSPQCFIVLNLTRYLLNVVHCPMIGSFEGNPWLRFCHSSSV